MDRNNYNTKQRDEIVEFFSRHRGSCFTAKDIIVSGEVTVGEATVYRTLNRLSDEGELLKVKINNGADHFDHQTFPHYHIRCTECGRVDDVMVPVLGTIEKEAEAGSGYVITGHSLQFDGICPACQAKAAE